MKKFDYSFLDKGLLTSNLVSITGNTYSLKTAAKQREAVHARVYTELEAIAKCSS